MLNIDIDINKIDKYTVYMYVYNVNKPPPQKPQKPQIPTSKNEFKSPEF